MGYAGYAPGHKVAEAVTSLEKALRSLPLEVAQETLELLDKLIRNVVRNPTEEKYRSVKLTNAKIVAAVESAPTMLDVLREMGWLKEGEVMTLPSTVRLLHEVHVVSLIDAKDWFKKEAENEKRRQLRAGKIDSATEELKKKMELDRKEKDAEGPVLFGSVAQKLGDGPNIMRAADIGINTNPGG